MAAELDVSEAGGPQEHLIGRWNAIAARGHQATLFAPAPRGEPMRELKFSFEPVGAFRRPRQAAFQWNLARAWRARLKAETPDLIYVRAGQWLLSPAMAAKRAGIPYVCEINGDIRGNLRARGFPPALAALATRIERHVCSHARKVLTVGPELNQMLENLYGIAPELLELSPAGVDIHEFSPRTDSHSGEVVIGYAGMFNWWHRLPTLIRALAALRDARPDLCWRAVLAGYGPEEPLLKAMVRELKLEHLVRFTGRIEPRRMSDVLRAFDAGVMPFRAFSIKFLQYAATGLPTIYPEAPHFAWLGDPGLKYSTDYPPESEHGLMGALARICEYAPLRAELSRRGRALAETKLDWERVAERMERLFSEIIGPGLRA